MLLLFIEVSIDTFKTSRTRMQHCLLLHFFLEILLNFALNPVLLNIKVAFGIDSKFCEASN